MSLPLLDRAKEDGVTYVLTSLPKRGPNTAPGERLHGIAPFPAAPRIPQRGLEPGEQYRFHFDMTTCVGCKCCIVACNEQNGNPADINWRRVGEIEGGWYPDTQRFYLSMGCNHCLEPSCLIACPTGSIRIEIVKTAEWKQEYAVSANAPGLPSADDSFSTTRITLPDDLPPDTS